MFEDIGKKLKDLAKVLFVLGCIASVIGAIALWGQNNEYTPTILPGIGVLVGGLVCAWISSAFVYGFGELIDRAGSIDRKLGGTGSAMSILTEEARDRKTISEGGWKCACGRINQSYVSTCACGKNKRDVLSRPQPAAEPAAQPAPVEAVPNCSLSEREKKILSEGGWQCVCGTVNHSYVSTCGCGRNKREVLSKKMKC